MSLVFDPFPLAGTTLANRVVMAPMTRSRADAESRTPTELTAVYYAQRASAGLIVTEGTQPSPVGQGYPATPGIHSAEQVAAWRRVTEAVHAEGGVIFLQIMHTGRIGHPSLTGLTPVAPSAVRAAGQVYTAEGPRDFVEPRALTGAEVEETIADFADAARKAIEAGFDGVEIHGANGYLVHQFLAPNTNVRADAWGGSPEGRIRFPVEVAKAVAAAIGPERVGFRMSPGNPFNGIAETDPADLEATYTALVDALAPLGLAYLHQMEAEGARDLVLRLRKQWPGAFVLNPYTGATPTGPESLKLVEDGTTDLLALGALFLANPDLPARLRAGGPFNTPDVATFYGGDTRGYTDYPPLGD
ncbi:alkene reductase [Streptomyces sp. SID11385]|uniref:oxidoreductase n=1 Tax=Streptomyces sp. SID11385 TaxID=2706031 RepID=UPI0013CD9438|nr:alkene reductase [Streptomyces sp. SID11385]